MEGSEKYKLVKKIPKTAAGETKGQVFKAIYAELLMKEVVGGGGEGIYRLAKIRQRRTEGLGAVKSVRDENESAGGRSVPQHVETHEGDMLKQQPHKIYPHGGDSGSGNNAESGEDSGIRQQTS